MIVKHKLKGLNTDLESFMLEYLYEGGFTLEKYYNDRRWSPEVPFREYMHRAWGEYLKLTYDLYGHLYFTQAQYKKLYDEGKLEDWLDWIQESTGNYMDDLAIWKQAQINLNHRLKEEKEGENNG